jgi:hypothetical protein
MTMRLHDCIIENLPAQAYHSDDAVGSSLIRKLQTSTPMHALAMLATPMASPAMALGTALHAAMLEPENDLAQAVVQPDIDKRTKAGKEEHATFAALNEGRCIITPDQAQQLDGMVIACLKDWRIKHALSACKKREVSAFGSIGVTKQRLGSMRGTVTAWCLISRPHATLRATSRRASPTLDTACKRRGIAKCFAVCSDPKVV